jgi:glycosyltransferase involved in cell wall biosynthesis
MRKRVLLLSYTFPPMALPEAILAAKTVGNLPACDIDVVCAAAGRHWQGCDNSLDDYVAKRFRNVHRIQQHPFARWFRFRFWPVLGRLPDIFVYSTRRLVKRATSLDLSRYTAIVSWSQFHSVHLGALLIKRQHPELRWMAHFSDPWVDNPYVPYGAVTRRLNAWMEGLVVRHADRLSFTTEDTADLFMKKYRDEWRCKSSVQPHAFDPELFSGEVIRGNGAGIVLRYIGSFYGKRSPEPLFLALGRIAEANPRLLDGIAVEFVGSVLGDCLRTEAFRRLPPGLVRIRGAVDYKQSLALMAEASALLVIDAPARRSVFLPSKLIDYIGSGRPIVGITPPGASANVIRRIGGWVADPSDTSAIATELDRVFQYLRSEASREPWGDDAVRRRFTVETVSAEFLQAML